MDRKGWQRPRPGGPIPTVKGEFEGDQYAGSFKDHKWHGVGTYTHADGDKYVGEYKDGKRHGQVFNIRTHRLLNMFFRI